MPVPRIAQRHPKSLEGRPVGRPFAPWWRRMDHRRERRAGRCHRTDQHRHGVAVLNRVELYNNGFAGLNTFGSGATGTSAAT